MLTFIIILVILSVWFCSAGSCDNRSHKQFNLRRTMVGLAMILACLGLCYAGLSIHKTDCAPCVRMSEVRRTEESLAFTDCEFLAGVFFLVGTIVICANIPETKED